MSDTNVDPREIAKFEALASRWWDRESEFKPLHQINPLRANWIDRHAPVAGKTVLDVGCGGGILTEALAQRGAEVTGIDMGAAPLAVAELHKLESGVAVSYHQISAEQMAQTHAGQFDVVTCLEMLEHVPDPASVVEACARLVKPGGDLFFSTINRNPKSYAFAILGAEYVLRLLPRGTHDYRKFIRPSELAGWLRENGLDLSHMTGMVYNPLTRVYRLKEGDVDVNYLVHARRVAPDTNGTKSRRSGVPLAGPSAAGTPPSSPQGRVHGASGRWNPGTAAPKTDETGVQPGPLGSENAEEARH